MAIPKPHEQAISELARLETESIRVHSLAAMRLEPEAVSTDDAILLREARRDVEHARILLEGICRCHKLGIQGEGT